MVFAYTLKYFQVHDPAFFWMAANIIARAITGRPGYTRVYSAFRNRRHPAFRRNCVRRDGDSLLNSETMIGLRLDGCRHLLCRPMVMGCVFRQWFRPLLSSNPGRATTCCFLSAVSLADLSVDWALPWKISPTRPSFKSKSRNPGWDSTVSG